MNPKREKLKRWFLDEPERMVARNGDLYKCEGQLFRAHRCNFGLDLNEVIYTRRDIQSLSDKEQEYFWDKMNCALNCGWFHMKLGHSKDYREFHLARMVTFYGHEKVINFIMNSPTLIKSPKPADNLRVI